MTQALLNNLNKISESGLCFNENAQITSNVNFSEILNLNTDKDLNLSDIDDENIQMPDILNSIAAPLFETISSILNEILPEAAAESVVETVVDSNNAEIIDIQQMTPDTDSYIQTDENENTASENNTANNENILIEVPTMNNELITPENTAEILFKSQIPITNSLCLQTNELQDLNSNVKSLLNENIIDEDIKKNIEIVLKESDTEYISNDNDFKTNTSKTYNKIDNEIVKELKAEVVEYHSNSDSGSFENFLQSQSSQEQTVKIILQTNTNTDIQYETVMESISSESKDINSNKIIEQISKQLETMNNTSRLNLILNPERLGKVSLQIINSKEGLAAEFTVTTQEAREVLMKGLTELKNNLLAQGVNIDSVNVKLQEAQESDTQFDWKDQENQQGGFKRQSRQQKKQEQEQQFETLIAESNDN